MTGDISKSNFDKENFHDVEKDLKVRKIIRNFSERSAECRSTDCRKNLKSQSNGTGENEANLLV